VSAAFESAGAVKAVERASVAMHRILKGSINAGASDIHLRANKPPMVRLEGELRRLDHPDLDPRLVDHIRATLAEYAELPRQRLARRQCDFACEVPGIGRFRVHAYQQNKSHALVLRFIPTPIPDFATLRIPPVVKRLTALQRGLILVTGATGNGKSTTIASLLERVNQEQARHVVTIESPIEYLFEERLATFSMREIGRDVDDTHAGLLGALREDPDWIFVGEIRELPEFELALSAAEAGHVVVSSLHAQDSVRAIQRMIHFFPEGQRDGVRQRLADSLAAIISQRLVARRGAVDRVLVTELLMRSPTVQDCIRDPNRLRGLSKALDAGASEYGTHSFDHQLYQLVRDGVVDVDVARAAASNPNDLVRAFKMGKRR